MVVVIYYSFRNGSHYMDFSRNINHRLPAESSSAIDIRICRFDNTWISISTVSEKVLSEYKPKVISNIYKLNTVIKNENTIYLENMKYSSDKL